MFNIFIFCMVNFVCFILGEVFINWFGDGWFKGYFVGLYLCGEFNFDGLVMLKDKGYDIFVFVFKSWDVFVGVDVLKMDIVIIVCDSVVGEVCFFWFGFLVKVYWGILDLVY